jgi:hypothetical protein
LMLADFFTKPLQGAPFKKLRDIIMGYKDINVILDREDTIKERVGNTTNENVIESRDKTKKGNVAPIRRSYADVARMRGIGDAGAGKMRVKVHQLK